MNGSFESPSHLERRIRAEIEGASDSSLSAPGFGRRAKSESLSFQTDQGTDDGRTSHGSYHPSTYRILPTDLSELDVGRTPTALRARPRPSTASGTSRTVEQQQRNSGPSNAREASFDESTSSFTLSRHSQDDLSHKRSQGQRQQQQRQQGVQLTSARPLNNSTSTDGSGKEAPHIEHSLPLTSTPQKTSVTQRSQKSQNTFYSQRSGDNARTGPTRSLANRVQQGPVREATGEQRRNVDEGEDYTQSSWLSSERSRSMVQPSAARTGNRSPATVELQQDISSVPAPSHDQSHQEETDEESTRDSIQNKSAETSGLHTEDIRPRGASPAERESDSETAVDSSERTQDQVSNSHGEVLAGHETTGQADEDVTPQTSPSARPAAAVQNRYNALATPRPAVSADRMQSYVLSSVKNPAREQRIQQSVRNTMTQRAKAQRVPLEQSMSEESANSTAIGSVGRTPAANARMDRLGRPMTVGAGRTPLPMRPSQLANEVSFGDASSQASEQSSTHDLMTPAKGWANTSLPGLGVAEGNVAQTGNRIDPHKLSRHLHKLNEGLLDENAELKASSTAAQQEAEALRRQLNVALREKENMAKQLANRRGDTSLDTRTPADIPLPPSPAPESDDETARALEEALEKIEELEGHKEELNDMLDALEQEHENLRRDFEDVQSQRPAGGEEGQDNTGQSKRSDAQSEREVLLDELEADLRRCESEIAQRDEELQELHDRLQESEEQRSNLQAEVEDATRFAMQETGRFEEQRDVAVADAEQQKRESERLRQQVEQLELDLEHLRAQRGDAANDSSATTRSSPSSSLVARLKGELDAAKQALADVRTSHQNERQELEELLRGHEEDLQAMEEERNHVDEQLRDVAGEVEELRDELDRKRIAVDEKENELLRLRRQAASSTGDKNGEELQRQLEDAQKRLESEKAAAARRESASLAEKDDQIERLRRQKQDLEMRLESYKQQVNVSTSLAAIATGSPKDGAMKTPHAKHRSVANLQTPIRTPQSPGLLSPASWLNHDSTLGNASVVDHIRQLEGLLAAANSQLDDKLAEIDEHGTQHLTLTRKLLEAKERIEELEAELKRALAAGVDGERLSKRALKRVSCTKCKVTFDATSQVLKERHGHDVGDISTVSDTNSKARSQQRDQALAEFIEKMPRLTAKLTEMEAENRALRDAAAKSNAKRPSSAGAASKDSARKLQSLTQAELERARMAIDELRDDLSEERRKLPALAKESKAFGELCSSAERDLARSELRLRSIEDELKRKAAEYSDLQRELAEKSSLGDEVNLAVQVLETQVRHTAKEVETLRQDRKDLLETRRHLHDQYRHATERYTRIQAELASARQAAESHQAQIEDQADKIERLHSTLQAQNDEMRKVAGDRDRLRSQREEIIADVSQLEGDLRRVRGESERFGHDLEALRRERDEHKRRAEAARETSMSVTAEAQETIALLRRRLDAAQRSIQQLEVDAEAGAGSAALKEKHAAECKGLLLQIRYLKTKFMRESDLRQDLCFQKTYLLQVVGGLEMSERETVKFLADLDRSRTGDHHRHPTTSASASRNGGRSPAFSKFKRCALGVLAATRMSLMASRWRETMAVKQALVDAHAAARKRRALREAEEDRSEEEGEDRREARAGREGHAKMGW
ncbi:unnamed protein product [Jaminaea pallidilutea]